MAFSGNDGQRSNVKMSDMITSLHAIHGGGSGLNTSTSTSSISSPSITGPGNSGTGMRLSYMYGKAQYTDSDGNGSDSGYFSYYNYHSLSTKPGGTVTYVDVGRFSHQYGRYRSATGAPSNSTMQMSGQINMSNLTGMSMSALTTDPCGETRGVKAGRTTGTTTKTIYARYQTGAFIGIYNKNSKPGIIVSGGKAGPGVDTTSADIVDMATHIGYSAYTTTHTNDWSHLSLNTKLCSGDRVIVVAHGGGGNMYTFSNTSPIYLRTSGNTAVSATISTLAAPHKNTTGSDDNLAVYSAVATGDGATRVLVNPFHSSAQPYIFHVFCIKGPNTTASVLSDYTDKYTTFETSVTDSNANATLGGFTTNQRYFIGVSTSPFTGNSTYGGSLGAIGSSEGYDAQYWTSGGTGAGFVTVCNYTGGTKGTTQTDKYGFTYTNPTTGWYVPQYGRMIPSKDGRLVRIAGTRG